VAVPTCPRCSVPLPDRPDYCWSCGYFVGDRWRTDALPDGATAEPRVISPDDPDADRPMRQVDDPARGGGATRRSLEVTSSPWLLRAMALAAVVIVVLLAVALLGGGGGAPGAGGGGGASSAVPTPTVATPSVATPAIATTPVALGPTGPTGPTTTARVTRVVDGDTIIVAIDGGTARVRYIGMDTPESVKPGTPVEPMAEEAAAANRDLVEGREVVLERDVSETDQYGRLLRDVWVQQDGRLLLVGLELVRRGFAQVTTFPPDVKYVDDLLAAQREARDAGVGLWAGS